MGIEEESKRKHSKRGLKNRRKQTAPVKAEETTDRLYSGRAFQRDDWKVRPFVQIGNMEVQFGFSRVVLWSVAGDSGEQLHWNFTVDPLMRPEFIIPREIESKLKAHVGLTQRDDNLARAFGFQRADHTLYYGDTAIFANGAVARSDFLPFAPFSESMAEELGTFIGDDVSWGLTGRMNGTADEGTDLE